MEDSSGHKKGKSVNPNVVEKITQHKYKNALLNNECLRHSISRTKNKNYKIGTYEISLPCFDDKIYFLKIEYNELAIGYQS